MFVFKTIFLTFSSTYLDFVSYTSRAILFRLALDPIVDQLSNLCKQLSFR